MAIFFMIFFSLVLFFVILNISDYDFISPGAIICIMTLLSLGVLAIYSSQYGISVSPKTACLVLASLLAASLFSLLTPSKLKHVTQICEISLFSSRVIGFSFLFILISAVLYFFEIRNIAVSMGYSPSGAFGMLYYYRVATTSGDTGAHSAIVGQMVIASLAIAYLNLVDCTKRIIFGKITMNKKAFILQILVILVYFVECILSGGRTQFLYLIESILFLMVFFYMKKTKKRINSKIISRIICAVVITYLSFFLLGNFTGKTNLLNASSTLFVYIGSPIAAFDKLVNGQVAFNNEFWGSNTFWGLFDILDRLGVDVKLGSMAAPFVNLAANLETNIYGAFARYYIAFGPLGIMVIPLILGAIYQIYYINLHRTNKNLELRLSIFLICSQFLFDFCIEERFFLSVLSLGTIIRIFYMVIFYYVFKSRIRIKVK